MPNEFGTHVRHAMDDAITGRELDVVHGVARGNSNKVISAKVHIFEHTVKNDVWSIMSKPAAKIARVRS